MELKTFCIFIITIIGFFSYFPKFFITIYINWKNQRNNETEYPIWYNKMILTTFFWVASLFLLQVIPSGLAIIIGICFFIRWICRKGNITYNGRLILMSMHTIEFFLVSTYFIYNLDNIYRYVFS